MVLCTRTCEREGDVHTISSLGVTRLVLSHAPVATMRHRHSPRLCDVALTGQQNGTRPVQLQIEGRGSCPWGNGGAWLWRS